LSTLNIASITVKPVIYKER